MQWEGWASSWPGCRAQGGGHSVSLFSLPSALSFPFSNHPTPTPHDGPEDIVGGMALLKYHILRVVLRVTGNKTCRAPGKISIP